MGHPLSPFRLALALLLSTAVSAPAAYARDAVPFTAVVVTLDGVRARDVFEAPELRRVPESLAERYSSTESVMPNLTELATRRGAALGVPGHGRSMRAGGPRFISFPGYIQILTGRSTSCSNNACLPRHRHTLIDELAALPNVPANQVGVFASWSRLGELVSRSPAGVVVSAGRKANRRDKRLRGSDEVARALEAGAAAGAFPGHDSYRPDRYTSHLALAWLEREKPAFLYLSLGDPDEYAHRYDYVGYLDSLRQADSTIARVVSVLDRLERDGRDTLLVVTTDHGRGPSFAVHDREPESGDVWLVAAGSLIEHAGPLELARGTELRDITPTLRAALGLPADLSRRAGRAIPELLPVQSHARELARSQFERRAHAGG